MFPISLFMKRLKRQRIGASDTKRGFTFASITPFTASLASLALFALFALAMGSPLPTAFASDLQDSLEELTRPAAPSPSFSDDLATGPYGATLQTGDSPRLPDVRAESEQDPRKPLALIWRGPGVCQPACGISAAQAARGAGYRTLSVFPGFAGAQAEARFAEAAVWIQPGGKSVIAAGAMGTDLITRLRRFIGDGGGYVGFCAGMFITTDEVGTSGKPGFGIVPGRTELYLKSDPPSYMIPITLDSKRVTRILYAGGPMLHVNERELEALGGRVTARYSDGAIAGVFVPFGLGKVSVIGTHPEAAWWWKLASGSLDFVSERWIVREMLRSVAPSARTR